MVMMVKEMNYDDFILCFGFGGGGGWFSVGE